MNNPMVSTQAELISLTNLADVRRCEANVRLDPEHKSAQGQFMTPSAVARFMASLYQVWEPREIRLLDPGAGVGSLTAAFVEEFLGREGLIESLAVTAYEPDPILAEELQDTFIECRDRCERASTAFAAELLQKDFIEAGAYQLGAGLQIAMWGEPIRRFTHAILNPPYQKIHSESVHRRLLRSMGIETSNLYTGFLAIAIRVLEPGGELVAITPRSFCNGPYFKPFRELLLREMSLLRIHVFESRTHAFKDDEVLQENIIFHAVKGQAQGQVTLSVSQDADFSHIESRVVDYAQVVHPNDAELFIHVVASENGQRLANQMKTLSCTLEDLDVEVSTGPVVDFRLKEYLHSDPQPGAVPLIYPIHCKNHSVTWPVTESRKPNAITDAASVRKWLYPNGHYVVIRRFSSKEERRRVVACLAWRMAAAGTLELDEEALYDELAAVRGRRTYTLDEMRQHLQSCGLLVALGEERYRLLHQLVQEYGAAAFLAAQSDCAEQLPQLAQTEWWRESCVLTLWLRPALQTPAYLLRIMGDAGIDLRVRVAAGEVLAAIGDPRFVRRAYANGVQAIEPAMVVIPAGEAILGGEDPEAYDDEQPECRVQVGAFELAVYPVTNAEFACFIAAGGYDDPTLWSAAGQAWLAGESKLDADSEAYYRWLHQQLVADTEGFLLRLNATATLSEQSKDTYRWLASVSEEENIRTWTRWFSSEGQQRQPRLWQDGRFNGRNQPVVGVNWYEAMAYAAWLTRVTGRAYRLPTEAEWEWAARRNRHRYPWGNEWDANACNWQGSKLNRPNPVGVFAFSATADGLHELAGNVYEWTTTLYRPYPYRADDGREDPNAEGRRVVRGGSWAVDQTSVRCARRDWNYAWGRNNNDGFRLARTSL